MSKEERQRFARKRNTVLRFPCHVAAHVTEEVDAEIEAMSDKHGCTRAESIRQLLEIAVRVTHMGEKR